MKSITFIGVDVSKDTLQVAVHGEVGSVCIANTVVAIRQWLKQLPPQAYSIGMESTGEYHKNLVRLAIAAGHKAYVLNARDLSHYAASLGRRAKTDHLDAQLIARYLAQEHDTLHPYCLPTELQEELDSLVQRRHVVVTSQVALRQSLAVLTNKPRALARTFRALTALIVELDQRMQLLVSQDPALSAIANNLRTIVGFGPLLSHTMANAITRHPFANDDAFIAFVGYDPRARDSGQRKGRRFLSKRGPAELRRLLYLAAMSASKTKLWQPFYER